MSNDVFPLSSLKGATYEVLKKPTWSRRRQQAMSGRELVVQDFANPIWEYKIPFNGLRDRPIGLIASEYKLLVNFFNTMQAVGDTFLFSDPDDNSVTDQSLGTGTGAKVDFQLVRQFVTGGFSEHIIAPNVVSEVKVNGTPTAAYTLNTSTGVITFTAAPALAATITATFTYYFRCRFEDDGIDLKKFANLFWSLEELRFHTVPL